MGPQPGRRSRDVIDLAEVDGIHDLGGMQGFGPVVPEQDEPVFHHDWERRVFGLNFSRLGANVDEFRHAIERMPPAEYLATSYYEHWLHAIETLAREKGVLDGPVAEPIPASVMLTALDELRPPPTPDPASAKFKVGDRVRVRHFSPPGHTRCPRYLRGAPGVIAAVQAEFALPDLSAQGVQQKEPVYTVEFDAGDLFDGATHRMYADLWETYLE